MTATAYERIIDKLHDLDLGPHTSYRSTTALCPSHDDRQASLVLYNKEDQGKARVICFAGCSDEFDILPALEMTVGDLYDERGTGKRSTPDPEALARYEARRHMTPSQRVLDDLVHRPDIGERICKTIGRIRPELYLQEKRQLEVCNNGVLLTDPCYRHISHLFGSDASDASHASEQKPGGTSDA